MVVPARDPTTATPTGSVSDRELAGRVQAGDDSAFDELFQRYNARLCLYLARLTNDDELGKEFAQEAFFKALVALRSMQEEVPYFRSWLYRIAINVVNDYWRRTKLIRWLPWPWKMHREYATHDGNIGAGPERRPEEIDEASFVLAGPDEVVEEAELVRMALARVSLKYRPSLLLAIVEELPRREIAQLLNISERSVRRYIKQGHEELCDAYQCLVNEQDTTVKRRTV
jgi:RNA polymerase sigma-70 factor, ECF subfamily